MSFSYDTILTTFEYCA